MLPIALVLAALAVAAALTLLARRHGPTAPPLVEPEAPKPRAAVLAEAVPVRARISGEVERPRRLAVVPPPPPTRARDTSEALDTLDALLAELESTTVRIDGADAFDESSVTELESLAIRLEAAAASLAST
jgi:hypothetical protein